MKKFIFTLVVFVAAYVKLFAIPATPYPIKVTQPDGSTITIKLKGDEKISWGETLDGYTLLNNGKKGWEYAEIDNQGKLTLSGILAHESGKQSLPEIEKIQKLKKNLWFNQDQIIKMNNEYESVFHSKKLIGNNAFFSINSNMPAKDGRKKVFTPQGTKRLLVILIEYQDVKFTKTQADFAGLMNTPGYSLNNAHGSVRDFFLENSYGQFDLTTDVAPHVYTAINNMAYYGADVIHDTWTDHSPKAGELVREAVLDADADGVDFSQYDNDGDGTVDGVYVIFAGYSQAVGGPSDNIWPHASGISPITVDGVKVSGYSCSNELEGTSGTNITTIGVICHEFGHTCGAPDYYDTNYATNGSFPGVGNWELMDYGSYNGSPSGSRPSHMSCFEKIRAGWITPITLTNATTITDMPDITTHPVAYIYHTTTNNEYYLMENRQKTGFNANCPGHGLLIFHYSKSFWDATQNTTAPQGFYPVCASSTTSPTTISPSADYGNINTTGCPFPGSSLKTSFTDVTIPTAKSWAGNNTSKPITNITETNGKISFVFINAPAINPILNFSSAALNNTQIKLNWLNNAAGNNVIIARNTTSTFGTPVSGTTYTAGSSIAGGGEVIFSGAASTFTDTGLNASTTYYYQIWATDGTNFSTNETANITTECNSLNMEVFTEGFESGTIPSCWKQEFTSGIKNWTVQTGGYTGSYSPSNAHTGTKNAIFFGESWTEYKTKLITPPLNLSSASNPVLKFWYIQQYFGGQDKLKVYYKTSFTDSWKQLAIYYNTVNNWTYETISLPNPSETYYIAFEGINGYGFGVCLDDIEIWQNATNNLNNWIGVTSNDWFTTSNWSLGFTPTYGTNVIIPSGTTFSPIINAAGATCANITVNSGATLSLGSGLGINGNMINNGTLNGGTSTVSVSGDWTNNGIFNSQSSTVNFNGLNDLQTINGTTATTSFYNVKVDKGEQNRTLEVKSVIAMTHLNSGYEPLNLSSGTFKLSSASTITPFYGDAAIGSKAGLWNNGGTMTLYWIYLSGLLRNSSGTTNLSSGYYLTYKGNSDILIEGGTFNLRGYIGPQSATDSCKIFSMTGGNLIINSSASSIPFSLNEKSTFNMSGGTIIVQKASAASCEYQNLCGNSNVTGGALQIGNTSTTGSPIIRINSKTPIYDFIINSTGTPTAKLLTNNLVVKNNVTINSATKLDANTLNLSIGGNWINNGGNLTATPTGTIIFNGNSSQTIGGTTGTIFNNVNQNNVNGLTLNSVDATMNGLLTLSSGVITTGNNKIIIPASGSVSRVSGHINGLLQKNVTTGTNISKIFEIGGNLETDYKPATVTFSNVSVSGNLTGKTTSGMHPNISTSTLNPAKSLKRYWTLTNNGIGFDNYNTEFIFSADDIDVSANPSSLIGGKYSSSTNSWEYPSVNNISSTSVGLTGLTSFSDFQFGEIKQVPTGLSNEKDKSIGININAEKQVMVYVNDFENGYNVMIFNEKGQLLAQNTFYTPIAVMKDRFDKGVYVVLVKTDKKDFSKKVIIN